MRRILLSIAGVIMSMGLYSQKMINKEAVNELELNTSLSSYSSDLFLITGEEDIYIKNPNLRENVLRNISNGIREGLYDGHTYSIIDGIRASRVTFFFYEDELYKVRWFFLKEDYSDLLDKAARLNRYLEKKYGMAEEQIPQILRVWQGKKRYLQTFTEEVEFQIEYRDEKIHQKVEKLKQ